MYIYVQNTCLTFGTDERNDPIRVTIVNTVVTPKATRAGIASFESQKLSQERTTIRNVGAYIWINEYPSRRSKMNTAHKWVKSEPC